MASNYYTMEFIINDIVYISLKEKDKILIVNRTLGDPSTTWDKTHHYTEHFKNRNLFIKNLMPFTTLIVFPYEKIVML